MLKNFGPVFAYAGLTLATTIFSVSMCSVIVGQIDNLPPAPFRQKSSHTFPNGESWSVGGGGEVSVTKDGVRKAVKISREDLNAISFVNDSTAVVVGNHGEILVTTDRGLNWERHSSGTTIDLQSVYCVDDQSCWIVGKENGLIIFGGPRRTWNDATVPTGAGGHSAVKDLNWRGERVVSEGSFADVFFLDRLFGFAVGRNGLVLKTTDGGKEWLRLGIPTKIRVTEFIDGIPNFESVVFKNALTGCLAGWDVGDRIVACTQSGGDIWIVSTVKVTPIGIFFRQDGAICIVDKFGDNQISNDGGRTWVPISRNVVGRPTIINLYRRKA